MEMITALLPLAVRAPGLQPRVSLASIQPTQNTGTALAVVRSERSLTVSASGSSVAVTSPPGTSVAVLKRQLFELDLRIVTGAFSRLVTSIFGLTPNVASSSAIKPASDIHPEFTSSTAVSQTVMQAQPYQRAAVSAAMSSALPASVQPTDFQQPIMPKFIEIPPEVRAQFAPATVIQPLTQVAALPVSPVSTAVASVAEVFRSTQLEQHKERRLDIFDVEFAARNHAIHPQMLSGNRLDLFA